MCAYSTRLEDGTHPKTSALDVSEVFPSNRMDVELFRTRWGQEARQRRDISAYLFDRKSHPQPNVEELFMGDESQAICLSQFNKIYRTSFPNVTIAKVIEL